MLLSRDETLSALFCETDRAQRMKMPLALIAVGLADWARAESEPGEPVSPAAANAHRGANQPGLLRCYDSVGQMGRGRIHSVCCRDAPLRNARTLAERLRDEVFACRWRPGGGKMRVKACFGVRRVGAASPFVVLRETSIKHCRSARIAGRGFDQMFDCK